MIFKIVIVGDGPEPCSTTVGVGEALKAACGRPDCPSCLSRSLHTQMASAGLLTHPESRFFTTYEPGQSTMVVEDLKAGVLDKRGAVERDRSVEVVDIGEEPR